MAIEDKRAQYIFSAIFNAKDFCLQCEVLWNVVGNNFKNQSTKTS